jgi:hypothetical protein
MPDLTIEKLVFFLFAVLPGFIAMQVYGLQCPQVKRDWGNSLVEVVTYSLINLTIWMFWILRLVRMPFAELNVVELVAAIVCICLISPTLLALGWYWVRTTYLHKTLKMDHPTPRGWDHFVKANHEFWVLFHWKNGKVSGGYFGENSYASTFPQDPEVYVEEMYRVDESGEFQEMVENTLGAVVRLSECERVEFLKVERKGSSDGVEKEGSQRATPVVGRKAGTEAVGADGCGAPAQG